MAEELEIPVAGNETEQSNDPLGILKPQKQSVSSDPLGILKKKVDGNVLNNGTSNTSQSKLVSDLYALADKVTKKPSDFTAKVSANTGDGKPIDDGMFRQTLPQATVPTNLPKSDVKDYERTLRTKEAILNTVKDNFEQQGKKFNEKSPEAQQAIQDLAAKEKNKDVSVVIGKDGKPYTTRGQGFIESTINTLKNSFAAPFKAFDINKINDPSQLANALDAESEEQPNIPESAPTGGIGGSLGQMAGGVVKPVALLSLNTAIPGLGTSAMVGEAYYTALAEKKREIYQQGLKDGLSREDAAKKALSQSGLQAVPDAAMAFALSGELHGISGAKSLVNQAADQSFRKAFVNSIKSVAKMAGLGAGAGALESGIKAAQGNDISIGDAIENVWDKATEYGKMDLGFKIASGLMAAPKYLVSAAKEYLTNIPKPIIDAQISDMGEDGLKIQQSLQSYQNARQKVEGLVPEEHISNFAGLIEKQDKIKQTISDLQMRKLLVPEPLRPKIDEQIAENQSQVDAIDGQMKKMSEVKDPSKQEIDDLTGQKVGTTHELEPVIPKPEEPLPTPSTVKSEGLKQTFENKVKIEDSLNEKYKGNKNVVYHGSPDISYLNDVSDINTKENTKNAESKYLSVNRKPSIAENYSSSQLEYGDKSGVAAFELNGKKYTLTKSDINNLKDNDAYEKFYDEKKKEGFDYVEVPQDGNNIVVLNNDAIKLLGKDFNHDILKNETTQDTKPTEEKVGQPEKLSENIQPTKSNKGVIKKAQGIEDLTNPRDIVLQHFANGGKIHSSAINDLFGGKNDKIRQNASTEGEKRARIGLLGKDADGIDKLADKLWRENDNRLDHDSKFTTQDYKEAIEQVLLDHNSSGGMARELVDKYIDNVKNNFTDAELKEISDQQIKNINKHIDKLDEDTQKELFGLLEKYQDQYGNIDWEKLHEDTNGFDPDILNLSEKTQKQLYELIDNKLKGQDELSNTDSQNKPSEEAKGNGNIKPPTNKPTSTNQAEGSGSELTGVTHAETDKVAREFGLGEYEPDPETREQWDAEADRRIKSNPDTVSELLAKLRKGEQPDKIEQRIMAKYLASLRAKLNADPTSDKLIQAYKTAKDLSDKIGGREVAKSLVARKDLVPVEDTIGDLMVREMEATGVDKLTDKQKEDIVSDYNKLKAAKDDAEAKMKILEEENARLKAESELKKTAKSTPSTKKSKEDVAKAREDIKQSIKDKWKKASNDGTLTAVPVPYAKQLAAIAPDVAKLVKSYVEEGVTELKEVVKKVLDDIKEYIPEITEKDVHDLIAGNYNEKKKTRNELAAKLKDLKDEAVYINRLEKLLSGEEPKDEKKKIQRNKQIKELQDKIKDYKKSEAEANKFYGESETGNRKIEKMEDELQRLKDRKEKEPSTTVKKELTEKEQELKKQIDEERKAFNKEKAEANKFYGEEIPSDVKSLIAYRKRLEAQSKSVQDAINKGEYEPEKKKQLGILDNPELQKKYPKKYKEAIEAKDKLIKLKQEREIKFLKQQYANRSKTDKVKDAALELINVPRALMSSFDFSAPLRQGIIPTISHPKVAFGAAKEMFANAFSQKRFDRYFTLLRESPEFKVMEKAGLYIADPHDHKLSAKEELFMNNLAEKIPFAGKIVAGSERAYVSYLNKMRADIFNQGANLLAKSGKTPENSPEDYKGLASWVNNSTGRGGMSKGMENASPILNSLFFSPRLIASRLNILGLSDIATGGKGFYSKLPKEIRKMVATDLIDFVLFGSIVLALAKANDADVEKDPRSSDFGKIRFGDTRYDIWGGFQQYIRFITQMATGEQKSSTSDRVTQLNGKDRFGKTRADVATSFFRGKLAPIPSMAWDFMQGRTAVGQKTDVGTELLDHFTPLIRNDIQDAWKNQGAKSLFTIGLPATFGIGVQTYTSKPNRNNAGGAGAGGNWVRPK